MAVIDAHAHIYPDKIAPKAVEAVGDFYNVDMFGDGTADGLLAAKDRAPITHFIVHSVATTAHAVTAINDFIAKQCQAHPEFIGFAAMQQDFEDPAAELQRAVELGLRGVKLHPDTQKVDMDDRASWRCTPSVSSWGCPWSSTRATTATTTRTRAAW